MDSLESKTLDQMNCEWDSYTTSTNPESNEKFWKHEWEKHGTCSLSVLPTEQDYFSKTLELNDGYDIDVALQEAGIDLTGSSADTNAIQKALSDAFGVQGVVKCTGDSVKEIWMCFDKTSYEPISCPSSLSNSCSRSVDFPEADSSVEPTCEKYFPSSSSSTTTSSSNSPGVATGGGVVPFPRSSTLMIGGLLVVCIHMMVRIRY